MTLRRGGAAAPHMAARGVMALHRGTINSAAVRFIARNKRPSASTAAYGDIAVWRIAWYKRQNSSGISAVSLIYRVCSCLSRVKSVARKCRASKVYKQARQTSAASDISYKYARKQTGAA